MSFKIPQQFQLTKPEIYSDDHYCEQDLSLQFSKRELLDGLLLKMECIDLISEVFSNFKFKKADSYRPEWVIRDEIIDIITDILIKLYPAVINHQDIKKCIDVDIDFKTSGDLITGPTTIESVNIKNIKINEKEFLK